jgi:cell fate (sporulation/competence/biofilm development) regulator YlbF (YheA/YmcA/DUF963 family)
MIYDKAHELAKEIKLSPEYREFKEAKEKIEKDNESLKIVNDFHTKQVEIQTMQMTGKQIPSEKMKEYEKMSEILTYNTKVREYLQAEYKIAKIMADIQKIFADTLELSIPGMEK